MKKQLLILSLSMLLTVFSFGQVTDYNFTFEPATTQGIWSYFENGSNKAGVTFVANPFPGGVNSSATVAKFTAAADGGEWSGCESLYGTLGKWKFDGLNPTTVTVDVYKTTLSPVHLKFTSTNAAGQGTVFVGSQVPSAINQWVTLTYVVDFATLGGENNADNNAGTNQVVLHVDQVTPRTADHDVYFDNIKFTATKLADPVADATLSDLKVDGTTIAGFLPATISYTVALPAGTTVVPTVTATTNDAEATTVITAATAIPGTSTVVVTAKDGTTKKTYSVVFSIAPAVPTIAAPTPTASASEVLSIFSNAYTNLDGTNFNPNWSQATVTTQIDIAGNNTLKYAGLNYQGTNLGSTDGTPQDLTSKTYMHLDYWTSDATLPLKVSLVSKTTGEKPYTCDPLTKESWVSVDIPLKYYTDLGLGINNIYQLKIEGNGTVYLDNIYFGSGAITGIDHLNASKNKVSVYPNPAENDLYFTSNSTFSKVAIYNTVGKKVKEYNNVLQSVNVSDLKTGVYMIKTIDVNGKTVTSKFIKK